MTGWRRPAVESAIRAAIAVVERRTGRALIARAAIWRPVRAAAAVPLIPVASVDAVEIVDGSEREAASGWRLTGEWMSGLPCPSGATVEVTMTLGYGDWGGGPGRPAAGGDPDRRVALRGAGRGLGRRCRGPRRS